jgi:hypothetical protein
MSGFSVMGTRNIDQSMEDEVFAQCDDMDNGAYLSVMHVSGGNWRLANSEWERTYWSCVNKGGQSDTDMILTGD